MTSTTVTARAQFINGLRDLARFLGGHFGPIKWCAQPVQLRGRVDYLDLGSGELLHRYTTATPPLHHRR